MSFGSNIWNCLKIWRYFKKLELNWFEIFLLLVNITIATICFGLFYYTNTHDDNSKYIIKGALLWWATYIANICNVISIILVIKKRISSLYWGIITVVLFSTICYFQQLLGLMILFIFYIVAQSVAIYTWKITSDDGVKIKTRKLNWWAILFVFLLVVGLVFGFYYLERFVDKDNTFFYDRTSNQKEYIYILDAIALMTGLVNLLLSFFRYRERWIAMIISESISASVFALQAKPNWVMFISSITLVISSCYGLYCWYIEKSKKQKVI